MGLALILIVVVATLVFTILAYNALARLRLLTRNAWADIDVQLKRRHDLIPALVSAVKGHAGYERGSLEALVQARDRALAAAGPAAAGNAERELAGTVRQVFAVAEAYPDLKAAESFLSLQRNLSDTENNIQNARRYYNAVVRDFNVKTEQFPSNLVASAFGFRPAEFFGLDNATERAVPSIDLGSGK